MPRQGRLSLREHDRHIPGHKGPTATPTAAVGFALFTSVMRVQFAVAEPHTRQGYGVQDDHRIVCEAVGMDPRWYQIAGSGQNSLLRTIPP